MESQQHGQGIQCNSDTARFSSMPVYRRADEYEGDRNGKFVDMIALFTKLTSSNIKISLSSRPWLVFEDAFQPFSSLRLQDLTFNDIKQYVDDKVSNHRRMNQLRCSDHGNAEALVDEVVKKASGVFLWVVLVVDSLLGG
jgi:hypothetical protein